MPEKPLDGLRVAVMVTDDFEQSELTEPMKALRDAGATALIVSPKGGEVQGMRHDEKADRFLVDVQLSQANPDEFDALMLPGGALNADHLRVVPEAQRFAQKIDEADKPIAVICHGPWLLVSAGLVSGRTITSYHTLKDDLRNAGAHWVNLEVVRDRNWVSSRGPSDLPAFNREMVDLIAECAPGTRRRKAA